MMFKTKDVCYTIGSFGSGNIHRKMCENARKFEHNNISSYGFCQCLENEKCQKNLVSLDFILKEIVPPEAHNEFVFKLLKRTSNK